MSYWLATVLLLVGLAAEAARVLVPAGPFPMGCSADDSSCDDDEGPRSGVEVHVDAFRIDRFEVSVAEYRSCVAAGSCSRPTDHNRNKYCNYDAPERAEHPLNCVDWEQARAFCAWRGGRLPYEVEWEKAARAGTTTRYPWGTARATCEHAIMDDGLTTAAGGSETDGCGEDRTAKRGSRGPNPLGLHDMHGSVAEWVYNWYHPDSHQTLYARGNPAGPAQGQRRVIRGGAWDERARALTSSSRWAKIPTGHRSLYGSNGLRCVYAP